MNIPVERIIQELSRPDAYPHLVDEVQVIQTHISIVFIAGDRVYKVKKPVYFDFLDFTTLQSRFHFCNEELRLNRRLSPDMYLYVAGVLDGPQGLLIPQPESEVQNDESPVEYAVVMKRLDENRLLSSLLAKGEVKPAGIDAIAAKITEFHQEADTSMEITRKGGTQAVIFNTEENFEEIEPFTGDTLTRETFRRIAEYTRTFLEVNTDLFKNRESEGLIRDGHGDLHTQHICMAEQIQIFDCIEFNERFRYGDVLSDAAFLKMDLERLGYGGLAQRFKKTYLDLMKQYGREGLFNFYTCYRAVVRGKVEGFRSRDPNINGLEAEKARIIAGSFFGLAEKYARKLVPPALIISCGPMGSGKSSLAQALGSTLDFVTLSSDQVRKKLAGIDPTSARHVPFGTDIYSEGFTRQTYDRLHELALDNLEEGRSVFLDASYIKAKLRQRAFQTAQRAGASFRLLYLDPPKEVLRQRLHERLKGPDTISDGREEILEDQLRIFEPPVEFAPEQVITLEGTRTLNDMIKEAYRRLLRQ